MLEKFAAGQLEEVLVECEQRAPLEKNAEKRQLLEDTARRLKKIVESSLK
jgi:hypothetical protein